MTSLEIVDDFYDSLIRDERILSVRERELLSNILHHAQDSGGASDGVPHEAIARAIGEVVAQRAYQILGERITQRLLKLQKPFYASGSSSGSSEQDLLTHELSARFREFRVGELANDPFPPRPPGPPAGVKQERTDPIAVADIPKTLRGDCAILDGFLSPAEFAALLQYTLEQESAFRISEVIQPGTSDGMIDYEQRRSRVLMELGEFRNLVVERIQACLPGALIKLECETFPVTNIEAQITASNDGDYFRCHSDNSQEESCEREITFVYFFHREPKKFRGGELRIYDSCRKDGVFIAMENYRSIAPRQNQIVFFTSSLMHEITPVQCGSRAFADSRFTVNGWLHR